MSGTELPTDDATLGILAWDICDAIAMTADDHGIDLGTDAIQLALPAFLAAVIANQAAEDQRGR